MKQLSRAVFAMVALVVAGCGEGAESAEEAASGTLSARDEAGATVVQVRGCSYAVATVTLPGQPPTFQVRVKRRASQNCLEASTILPQPGSNFIEQPLLVTTKGGQAIVVEFAFKNTPSGSAAVAAEIVAVEPKTLDTIRTAELRRMPTMTTTPSVEVESLLFRGNSLIVDGTFGPFGGAQTPFTAVFSKFLRSDEPPTITP